MMLNITEIKINPSRRAAQAEQVAELAKSISQLGLLNPITVDQEYGLIAGLHRLEAVKQLGWTKIECTVTSLEGLEAELAEIDENIVRPNLSTVACGELLLRRKEIYEALYPETKNGGDRRSEKIRTTKCRSDREHTFVQDAAEKLGVNRRTIERQIQVAKHLSPKVKTIIQNSDTKVTQADALKLSRLEPAQQEQAASQLAQGEISSIREYIQQQNAAQEEYLPYHLESKQYSSFRESIADLKNPDKDCSCTPDSFLAELTAFVKKFQREIQWFSTPYYEAVFSLLSDRQRDYLKQQMNAICQEAHTLVEQTERMEKV